MKFFNKTNGNLKLFESEALQYLDNYSLDQLMRPNMINKLEKVEPIRKRIIEIPVYEMVHCPSYGLDEYYIYSPNGVIVINQECNEYEVTSMGRIKIDMEDGVFIISNVKPFKLSHGLNELRKSTRHKKHKNKRY